MEVDAEKECVRILALSHPVAGDLRLVLATARITTDLERIGDMAKGIAKRALHLEEIVAPGIPTILQQMSKATTDMFGQAIEALANEDVVQARSVLAQDERVDDLQKEMFVWARDAIMDDPEQTEACIDMLSIARKLERIADLSTNISEEVIFLVEGKVTKHADARPVQTS
jgi:phosphate transport system protein